ncbi:MAG: hypothetical protein OXC60_03460 [Litoreibacter sp.]|nr:hypothetical protein [Litoreibacter sp.]
MTGWRDINVSPGTLADDRLPVVLGDGRFKVRPDDLAARFCLAAKRLGVQSGADEGARSRDMWHRLFDAEPAYLFSQILAFNPQDAAFSFERALQEDPSEARAQILALCRQLQFWLSRIKVLAPTQFSKQLKQLNHEVALEQMLDDLTHAGLSGLVPCVMNQSKLLRRTAQPENALLRARAQAEALKTAHRVLRNAAASLQQQARVAFEARIASEEIEPSLGLLLSELRAAEHVETRINGFLDRHTRFFYEDIIGQSPRKAGPELVLLDLNVAGTQLYLPQGTGLEARLPDNVVQRFETDAAVHLNPAKVAQMATFRYDADPRNSFNAAFNGITSIWAGHGLPDEQSVGVFGAGARHPVRMGLDIASPILNLAEGTRHIRARLVLSRSSGLRAHPQRLSKEGV